MKKNIAFATSLLCIALFLIDCKDHKKKDTADGHAALIDALKNLKKTIASRDKDEIAALFNFPVPDSVFRPSLDNTSFRAAYEGGNGLLTESMFNQYFGSIKKDMELENLDSIFLKLDLQQLRTKKRLHRDNRKKTEPIYNYWEIERETDSTVTLRWGSNSNKDWVPAKNEKVDEDFDPSSGEYSCWWIFVFDGRRLKVIGQGAAG